MSAANELGAALGRAMAPFVALASTVRRGRMFHPAGVLFRAEVTPSARGPASPLAARLSGPALVRFSAALFRADHGPDVLGCALRFGVSGDEPASQDIASAQPDARALEQDLLLATIRRPWTMVGSLFATNVDDYLANRFYGVSPFVVDGGHDAGFVGGKVEWRLDAAAPSPAIDDEALRGRARLRSEAATGGVVLHLSWAPYPGWWRLPNEAAFEPVVRIRLVEEATLSQERLRFDPFRAGRGIHPVGLVHAARLPTYRASQRARSRVSR